MLEVIYQSESHYWDLNLAVKGLSEAYMCDYMASMSFKKYVQVPVAFTAVTALLMNCDERVHMHVCLKGRKKAG